MKYIPSFQAIIERYKKYAPETIGEYRERKQYPSGKDVRPMFFDPKGSDVVAHGTNLDALLRASVNCNLQIVPGIKMFKLQGQQHGSGESARSGDTSLNCKYVSAVMLDTPNCNFYCVKEYAGLTASLFLKTIKNTINSIPVIVIGDIAAMHS